MIGVLLIGCSPGERAPEPSPEPEWTVLGAALPEALLSAFGDQRGSLHLVGADTGSGAAVYRLRGDGWIREPVDEPGDLWWGFQDAGLTWLVGEGRLVRHRTHDGSFETDEVHPDADLFGIWGAPRSPKWLVGGSSAGPVLLSEDDWGEWVQASLPVQVEGALFKVWGRSSDDVWAVGSSGLTLHFDGEAWTRVVTPVQEDLFTVHGSSAGTWAVGGLTQGRILSWQAGEWIEESPAYAPRLQGVHARDGCSPVAVGLTGAVYQRHDGVWERYQAPTEADLHAVWMDDDCGIFAVGGDFTSWPLDGGVALYRGTNPPPALDEAEIAPPDTAWSPPGDWVTSVACDDSSLDLVSAGRPDRLLWNEQDVPIAERHYQGLWTRFATTGLPGACEDTQVFRLFGGDEELECVGWGDQLPGGCLPW